MILPLLILAAQVSGTPQVSSAPPRVVPPPGSGAELMVQCIAAEGMILGATGGDSIEKGALCIGYVDGYMDGAKTGVCIPPRSLMAVIYSYLQYMKDNSKYYEMPKAVGLRASIDATYPCRK